MMDAEIGMMARGALIALLLLPAGIWLAWRWTAAMATGPATMRALVACAAGMVPALVVPIVWATNASTQGRAHAVAEGSVWAVGIGAALTMLLLSLLPRPR